MDAIQIIKLIQTAATLSQSLTALVGQVQGSLSSQDKEAVAQALKDLQGKNDQLHHDVQGELRS